MAPTGCRTHRHASRDILQNMIISYITYITYITSHLGYTTSHTSCKNKLDASTYCCKFYVVSMGCIHEPFITYAKPQRGFKYCYKLLQASRCKLDLTIARETDIRQLLIQYKLHVKRRTGLMYVDM